MGLHVPIFISEGCGAAHRLNADEDLQYLHIQGVPNRVVRLLGIFFPAAAKAPVTCP